MNKKSLSRRSARASSAAPRKYVALSLCAVLLALCGVLLLTHTTSSFAQKRTAIRLPAGASASVSASAPRAKERERERELRNSSRLTGKTQPAPLTYVPVNQNTETVG